jgi:hypothetical protein
MLAMLVACFLVLNYVGGFVADLASVPVLDNVLVAYVLVLADTGGLCCSAGDFDDLCYSAG